MGRRPARLVGRARPALLAVVVAGALLGGCGAITVLIDLQTRIEAAGYDVGSVFHDDVGTSNEVQVVAGVGRGSPAPEGNEEIAGIVWRTYPRRFETVVVTLDDRRTTFTRPALEDAFGRRDPELDEREFSEDLASGLLVGLIIGALLLLAVGVLIFVLVRRSNRRRRRPPPGAPPVWGPPGHAWAPPTTTSGYPPPQPESPPPGWLPPSGYPPPQV